MDNAIEVVALLRKHSELELRQDIPLARRSWSSYLGDLETKYVSRIAGCCESIGWQIQHSRAARNRGR
jgi:hypothetical protein